MKLRIVVIVVAVVCAAGIAAFFAFTRPDPPPNTVLPNPNGYDDFTAATQWRVGWDGDLLDLPVDEIREVVGQNSKTLETVREGLSKASAVPVTNDMNWLSFHMVQLPHYKAVAQLLVAEGFVHLREGRTNEAARSLTDCIRFAHASHRGGLMIDDLVGIACQAIGVQRLVPVAAHLSPDVRQEILLELIALDQAREPAAAIVQRDRAWARGAYGWAGSTAARLFTRRSLQAAEKNFERKHARSVAALRLLMTELAVRSYEARTGKLPGALADLVPGWLPAVPVDPFRDGPLVYRATTNSFLLYSVGPDGHDDRGIPLTQGETGDLLSTAP